MATLTGVDGATSTLRLLNIIPRARGGSLTCVNPVHRIGSAGN